MSFQSFTLSNSNTATQPLHADKGSLKAEVLSVLDDIQKLVWLKQGAKPETNREVLARLSEGAKVCLNAFSDNQLVKAQAALDDLLVHVFIAMQSLELRPSQAIQRALSRMEKYPDNRFFHVYTDRVEIRVNKEVRGAWPIYTMSDYQAALRLAHELECDVIHEEAYQLELFQTGGTHTVLEHRHQTGTVALE